MWNKISENPPPYDTLVLVRGKDSVTDPKGVEHSWWSHALAFNQCYRPDCNLSRVVDLPIDFYKEYKIPPFIPFSVEPEEWMEIPD